MRLRRPPVKAPRVPACWWTIHSEELIAALTRCHNGEDPEMVYIELHANTEDPGA